MLKKISLILFAVFAGFAAKAQSAPADSVYSKYLDFNLARFSGNQDQLIALGEVILPNADKLPEKARINFYFAIGKMYDDNGQPKKAVLYYEKVAAAVPDYYVVHRALGYLYAGDVKEIERQLSAATTNYAENQRLTKLYTAAVKKALPHLEKAQACDPSDETLALIKLFYKNIKDTTGLNSLDSRLKELSKNCIDLLGS